HTQMHKYRDNVIQILKDNGVKLTPEQIFSDIDRDFWLEPKEAIEYGLADEIMTPEIWREMIKEGECAKYL
ncbi:MAG: ATP-dependent Clp protease proteolytic subunit, partial [Proteobacteria bacterium]|nr:ATP-dependent Clp protease proteolytic subunit [Pseudomonadota bacterium]